ncbi:cupredoxin family copper-binding protein [Nocardia farcinica]|uniref:cupredoxin domain-containing protein n=1 Tax=Nocardia farcinica TaxID=37329 RepID=UPI000BF80E93|nr:cupredoxin family copper-binding protein [Nocardia farcinica]MBF6251525.1 cupredoxin family copper-binding protein [Nocardia farcinica]MBF6263030.1 cupredoxin family copper-binding protein [Nocardia farcinica]MBF6281534.1 cupredoxin family copper-binding protein [Nocardia farcinica]MBF6305670.1 cupredoxin family copper-binding protein [Nocardia farcinica]MBF6373844.1 cupredoxin family copper-binding protein [Nocardia farcinica]
MPTLHRGLSARVVAALALTASIALAGCGSDASESAPSSTSASTTSAPATSAPAGPSSVTVTVDDMTFSPENITVGVGDTVTWKFSDSAPHSVQGIGDKAMGINSPILDSGEWSYTFTVPGTFRYLCTLHPQMRGSVTVE